MFARVHTLSAGQRWVLLHTGPGDKTSSFCGGGGSFYYFIFWWGVGFGFLIAMLYTAEKYLFRLLLRSKSILRIYLTKYISM